MRLIALAALGLSFACASTTASSAPAGAQAGSCSQVMVDQGAVIYSQPDDTSRRITVLPARTQVCVDPDPVGFNFRHVKLTDGKDGYLKASELM